MKITGDWLGHPGTQEVFHRLRDSGHAAFAVGGCVRNDLLGIPVADVDIATPARPDEMLAAFEGLHCVPTGIEHGTLTVIAAGKPHEVTTLRQDVETDGRHAVVVFGTDIAKDAGRRDFTMNALYADADGHIFDPLGGLPDLHARRVRFIGAADARIREDYLRILRFFRFTALFANEIDADGLAACAELQDGLSRISAERTGQELKKLLNAPDPAASVAAMAQSGMLARVLPGADHTALAPLVHLEDRAPPDPLRRLAALGGDVSGLRLSRSDATVIRDLAAGARGTETPFALGHILGAERGLDALLIRGALLGQRQDASDIGRGATAVFPLKAADFAPLAGPPLGQALATARARWLCARGTLDARALLKMAKENKV